LASNSLLEGLVYGYRVSTDIAQRINGIDFKTEVPNWDARGTTEPRELVLMTQSLKELKEIMSNYVGIVRTEVRLKRALDRLYLLYKEAEELYKTTTISPQLVELQNLICNSYLITRAAQMRKESRGLHYNTDFPSEYDYLENTIM
jgi:L-aspartate oxidase